jgi:hypothetical protein
MPRWQSKNATARPEGRSTNRLRTMRPPRYERVSGGAISGDLVPVQWLYAHSVGPLLARPVVARTFKGSRIMLTAVETCSAGKANSPRMLSSAPIREDEESGGGRLTVAGLKGCDDDWCSLGAPDESEAGKPEQGD